jgi:uncharacterized membrane protein YkvA (DUF1232 family)
MGMNNKFFDLALNRASKLTGKKGRIIVLLGQMAYKINSVDDKRVLMTSSKTKFMTLSRLVAAFVKNRYRNVSWKSIVIVLAAIIYFIDPIDLLPDFIPVAGLTDDLGVLLWVYSSINSEIQKFLEWEETQMEQA